MLRPGHSFTLEREKALADGLRDVAAELRLIEATDLVAFLRTEQFGNIANLVNSSTELYFSRRCRPASTSPTSILPPGRRTRTPTRPASSRPSPTRA
jgi:hypothetical protein